MLPHAKPSWGWHATALMGTWGQWRSEDASVLGSLGIPSLREAVRAQGNRLKR